MSIFCRCRWSIRKICRQRALPGGFLKREARPSDYEILVARLIDRALRPLFPSDYHADVFVTVTLLSADPDIQPDALAGLAASSALAVSTLPFGGPISEVRVARIDGEFVINPTFSQMEKNQCDLDIMVVATIDNIMMVEGEMKEVSEAVMLDAIKFAHEEIKKQCQAQLELMRAVGKTEKRTYCHEQNDPALRDAVAAATYDQVYEVAKSQLPKHERSDKFDEVLERYLADFAAQHGEEERAAKESMIRRYFHDYALKPAMRNMILNEGIRLDGRKTTEIRPIWCEVGYLPAPHGSAIFTRGETQSLTTVTLGTKLDEKMIDDVLREGSERFVLHYNFPPFSTGEARPARGLSRREIGHGNLALRALKPMIPDEAECPYAIRVVSDILESNGSSSMATVCAGTLALMDAGVKIKKPVSGIAMGLIAEGDRVAVLSDILGDEDHLGDMDFKVTGTVDGITATQMDIKVDGLSYEVLAAALEQARQGRMHILGKITETIAAPREDYKPHVPRMVQITIPKEFIGAVIGPGGKVIQEMQKETGTTITITEEGEIGKVDVFGADKEGGSCHRPDQGDDCRAGSRDRLPRESEIGGGFRRLHRDPAGEGRAAPHLGNRPPAVRDHGRDRYQGGRYDGREAHRHRPEERQTEALAEGLDRQGVAAGRSGGEFLRRWKPFFETNLYLCCS